ncbi:MAG TPA: DNA repair protein RecO, partial [Achromobacter sp.]|nr:DNA repair protein RecO [Achromobacter sp.]
MRSAIWAMSRRAPRVQDRPGFMLHATA